MQIKFVWPFVGFFAVIRDLESQHWALRGWVPSSFQFGVPFFLDLAHAWMLLWNRCWAAWAQQSHHHDRAAIQMLFAKKTAWQSFASVSKSHEFFDLALLKCWFYPCFHNLFSTSMLNKPVDQMAIWSSTLYIYWEMPVLSNWALSLVLSKLDLF